MLNNKGFAVSAVLYTILIAFLLFLGVTLSNFSAAANVISNANKDLVNGTGFKVMQVKAFVVDKECGTDYKWYQTINSDGEIVQSNTIVQIKSRYGTFYWPKDFENAKMKNDGSDIDDEGGQSYNKKITVTKTGNLKLKFSVDGYSSTVELTDICAGS